MSSVKFEVIRTYEGHKALRCLDDRARLFSVLTGGNLPLSDRDLEVGTKADRLPMLLWEELKKYLSKHGTEQQRQIYAHDPIILPDDVWCKLVKVGHFSAPFDRDGCTRDIYEIFFSRGEKTKKFNFYQSMNESDWDNYKDTDVANMSGLPCPFDSDKIQDLRDNHKATEPFLSDIISELEVVNVPSFSSFCRTWNIEVEDADSNIHRFYEEKKSQYDEMRQIFTEEELRRFNYKLIGLM